MSNKNKNKQSKVNNVYNYCKELFEIMFAFMKIGFVAFGGGLAIAKIYEREFVDKRHWITKEELYDYYFLSQITPGIIIVSTSSYIGYKLKKQMGLFASVIGVLIPSILVICLVSLGLNYFINYPITQHILKGMNVAVLAIIIDINIDLLKNNVNNLYYAVICLLSFILVQFYKVPVVIVIFISIILGLIYRENNTRKFFNKKNNMKGGIE